MTKKFVDLRITAISDEDLKEFLFALRKIQYCGDVGMSRMLPIKIDGDGSGNIDIEVHTQSIDSAELKNIREILTLNAENIKKVEDGADFETHYIGE